MDQAAAFESQYEAAGEEVRTVEADAQIGQIKQLLRVDGEFFIEFFLAEHLDMPVPEFHVEIWGLLTGTAMERVLLAIPRDHAKTTLSKLAVVWHWLFTSHRFAVYLSNTSTIAKNACKDIIAYLKTPNFVQVYGAIKMIKESETEGVWQFDLPMENGRVKRCILRAVGQGQQMRGINIDNQRPDLAIVDDVEDNENTESEFLQAKLDRWVFGPFLKALARKKKIVWLGNMLQKTSLLARLSRNPKWNPVVFGALIKDAVTGALRPLWPDKWSVESLIDDFKEYKDLGLIETWMCEMMNMPGHGENGFTANQIKYQPVPTPDELIAAWITVDPAFGMKSENDNTAIVVHGLTEGGVPQVLAYANSKMDEHTMFETIWGFANYWNAWVWGIEAIAAQKVLITLFDLLLIGKMAQGRAVMIPLMAGKGDPKISRIRAWVSLMANGEYAIPEGDVEITNQLVSIDTRKKEQTDDLVDSCAYGPQMLTNFEGLLIEQFNGANFEAQAAQYGRRVSGI